MKTLATPFNKWLIVVVAFIACMVFCRIYYTKNIGYLFLIWNVFLAAIPYYTTVWLKNTQQKNRWVTIIALAFWLLFFPNALYIVTDIIHLRYNQDIPIWFDAILLFTAASIGLIFAFASLKNVEQILLKTFSKQIVKFTIFICLFLGSFGVYLGRFMRLNSWDVFTNPTAIFIGIANKFLHPFAHPKTWVVTFLLLVLYSLCWQFGKIVNQRNNNFC